MLQVSTTPNSGHLSDSNSDASTDPDMPGLTPKSDYNTNSDFSNEFDEDQPDIFRVFAAEKKKRTNKPCRLPKASVLKAPKLPPSGSTLLSRAVLTPPSLNYKPITSVPRDHGNISHDPTHDSSRDPFAIHTSRDLSARDPGNLRPRDPGKITHDLSRKWSSTMSPDKMRFGCASNPLINMWQIVGTINKTRPLNNQRTRDAT